MVDGAAEHLGESERDELLGRGGTGVLSVATTGEGPPYSLPVSYGFDPAFGQFYFRLADGTGAKWDALDDGSMVSFVTYDQNEGDWWSVVATGPIEAIPEDEVDPDVGEAMRRVQIPIVDVYDAPPRELTFRIFRLDPDEVTARTEVHAED